jgi:hypothetical protein
LTKVWLTGTRSPEGEFTAQWEKVVYLEPRMEPLYCSRDGTHSSEALSDSAGKNLIVNLHISDALSIHYPPSCHDVSAICSGDALSIHYVHHDVSAICSGDALSIHYVHHDTMMSQPYVEFKIWYRREMFTVCTFNTPSHFLYVNVSHFGSWWLVQHFRVLVRLLGARFTNIISFLLWTWSPGALHMLQGHI